jgi:hypothetical protein
MPQTTAPGRTQLLPVGDTNRGPRCVELLLYIWDFFVTRFTDLVASPLYDVGDDAATKHRKNIFAYASVFYMVEAATIVAVVFGVGGFGSDDACDGYLAYSAILGFLITLFLYVYSRIQQTCFDVVIGVQFLQTSLQQYIFTLFTPSSNACVGAVGMIATSLLYAACRIPVHYHVFPVLASLFVFTSTIADVSYGVGVSSSFCERDLKAAVMLPVATVMMVQFYAVVGMTSVSTFVVSLYKDEDMRGFFSLRMANVVLGLIAGLNFEIAHRVLAVCRGDVSEDLYNHFQKIVVSIQRYAAYVPPSVWRPAGKTNDASLLMSSLSPGMILAQQRSSDNHTVVDLIGGEGRAAGSHNGGRGAFFPNPLSSEALRERSPVEASEGRDEVELDAIDAAAGQVIATLFSDHRGSGASTIAAATLLNQFHQSQRNFESKSATVVRVSFSLAAAQRKGDEAHVVRCAMVEFVKVCDMYHGEIEEATSTFVLLSFGVRFHQAHEQVAVDCALALHRALTATVFRPSSLHIAIVSGEIAWGTYITSEKSFVVIGGFPVELATKLNSLQEQLQAPIVATTDTVSHCRNSFIPIDLCRPAGHIQPLQVFELLHQDDVTEDVKMSMSEALSLLARGERMIPPALDILVAIKDVCFQAARLARLLSKLPQDVEYCKDEVPWVSNSDQVTMMHPVFQHALLNNGPGAMMSPDGQPHSLLDGSVVGLLPAGAGTLGDTVSIASVSTRHGPLSLFGGEDDEDDDSNEGSEHHDPMTLQQWTLGPLVADGNTCSVVLALGTSGTIGAAIRYKHIDLELAPRELFLLCGGGKMVARAIARLFAVVPDTTKPSGSEELLVVTEYFSQGSLKQFLRDYKGATMRSMTWVNYVREIVRGAVFLNNHWRIVHGCIRPSCVLLGDDSRCALTKYGLVPPHKGHPDHMFYAAPELVLTDSKKRKKDVDVLTSALDVWSIGITALELMGCQNPIRSLCNNDPNKCVSLFSSKRGISQSALSDNIRTSMRGAPHAMVDFILRCLVIEPQDRMLIRDAWQLMEGINIAQELS